MRAVANSLFRSRLIPFEFSTTQAFALEFGNNVIRFFANGGIVLDGGSPYSIVSPYTSAELAEINFAQSADVVYLVHPNHAPRKLARFGPTNWTLTEVVFTRPPFQDLNFGNTTLTASALTGAGIVGERTGGRIGDEYRVGTCGHRGRRHRLAGRRHDSGHDPVGEQEVEGAIDTLRGIDQPPAGEQDRLHVADLRAPASR